MSFLQAVRYFFREAAVNLFRSWKVSLLAVFTIAVSLGLSGLFLVVGRNLSEALERWRAETRVVVYLQPSVPEEGLRRLAGELQTATWVAKADPVTAAEARQHFREVFPSLADLVANQEAESLPPSIELTLRSGSGQTPAGLDAWLAALKKRPDVSLVDDDREWLRQLAAVVAVVRSAGLLLGAVLLGAAIFTIASVIRLTAYLHHEEISILRLVGATEFFIRGPFYAEGMLQGLLGSVLALGGLFGTFQLAKAKLAESSLASLLTRQFLDPEQIAWLVGLGVLAGLVGAVFSLRREAL